MYVFRSGRRAIDVPPLVRALANACGWKPREAERPFAHATVDALLRAGELECGLADAGASVTAALAAVTDALADAVVCGARAQPDRAGLCGDLASLALPSRIEAAPPEGFAYYALHPRDFAALAEAVEVPSGAPIVVVGIRTIGTTLAAVVAATMRRRGHAARRITVRPAGHPYLRTARFSPADEATITSAAPATRFFVADEGPGNSGSSFLSVAQELERLGVERARIALLCSRDVDPASLVAPSAPDRWRAFRSYAARGVRRPADDAAIWVGGGTWRSRLFADQGDWPAAWTEMERAKVLSRCGRRVYKFEGLGRHGAEVRDRARLLSGAGVVPPGEIVEADEGFVAYPFVTGRPLARIDGTAEVITFLADYCALRVGAFPAPDCDVTALHEMVVVNGAEELGYEPPLALEAPRPTICDGRFMPHELVRAADTGALYKTDAVAHGDDHFLPGPADIAWDLAGVVFEWALGPAEEGAFVERYARRSGDDPRARLPAWLLAYALYRTGYWKMAAACSHGLPEEARLLAAYGRARESLRRLARHTAAVTPAIVPSRTFPGGSGAAG